jgi:hypothetical protein
MCSSAWPKSTQEGCSIITIKYVSKTYGGVEAISVYYGPECQMIPGCQLHPGTRWIGGRRTPRAGLDARRKSLFPLPIPAPNVEGKELSGFSSQANYTDRATAAFRLN